MPNRVGQQLGNYRLLRLLGRGGFAEVYLGEHVYLKRRAALKVLHTSLEDEDIDPFLAEAQLLARLNHPHIVRVHDFAVEQATQFLAMDYALGIVVYEWLCGVRAFEGSMPEVMVQHLTMPPPALREKDPSLPEAVEAVVLKALAKEPEDRYGSVLLFAQALEQAITVSLLDLRSDTGVTAPLGPLSFPPSELPPVIPRRVFVSASHADHAFVAHLKTDLQKRGIIAWDENPYRTQNTLEPEDSVRQVIRAVDVVFVVLAPAARSSCTIKEHLRIAGLYQRRLLFLWATGDESTAALPVEWNNTDEVELIDAREMRYEQALEEIVASLHKG